MSHPGSLLKLVRWSFYPDHRGVSIQRSESSIPELGLYRGQVTNSEIIIAHGQFTLPEYSRSLSQKDLDSLFKFGGFPETLFEKDEDNHRIWIRDRMSRVVLEDLRNVENVKEVSLVLLLAELLPAKVGSPLPFRYFCRNIPLV